MKEIIENPTSDVVCTTQAEQTFQLLQQAVNAGTSPEALERLVALQERIMAHDARAQYITALSEFQARCPTVEKRKHVKDRGGRLLYSFAPLEDIIAQVRPLLAELGLSYSFDSETADTGAVNVTCTIRHKGGHEEQTFIGIPATKGHNTNAAQDAGIALTYGKRYAFIGALGITTADEDTDGNSQGKRPISEQQAADLLTLVGEVGADLGKFLSYLGVDRIEDIASQDYDRAVSALEAKRRSAGIGGKWE